jgi:hypothetical protein
MVIIRVWLSLVKDTAGTNPFAAESIFECNCTNNEFTINRGTEGPFASQVENQGYSRALFNSEPFLNFGWPGWPGEHELL